MGDEHHRAVIAFHPALFPDAQLQRPRLVELDPVIFRDVDPFVPVRDVGGEGELQTFVKIHRRFP